MKLSKLFKPFLRTSSSDAAERELQDLVWMAVDGAASEEDFARLQNLVRTQQRAREAYLDAVELDGLLGAVCTCGPQPAKAS